jgi:serine/threonine protein phosphatase PrpC
MSVHLSIAGVTDIGRMREQNEDALVIADVGNGVMLRGDTAQTHVDVGKRGVLLAVSDGMGGEKAGEVASAVVVETMARTMMDRAGRRRAVSLVEGAIQEANQEVVRVANHPDRRGMGATLTAVFVQPHEAGATAYIAEVGDSRAYLVRSGQMTLLTKDQSYVQMLVDGGVLDAREAAESPMRNVVLQAMGRRGSIDVAMGRIELCSRDCLLLCSDGLTGAVSDVEIRDIVLRAKTLERACGRLVRLANDRGGMDNITVLTAGVGGDLPLPSAARDEELQVISSFRGAGKGA